MNAAQLKTSDVFMWNYRCTAPVVVNQGGASSGKTYALMQVLFCHAIQQVNVVITVAGQDIPNLKVGALRDAANIVNDTPAFQQEIEDYNKSDRIYTFKNGSRMEFNSYDGGQDAKSGKRDYLFVNEANGVPYAVYQQLALRTKKQVFIDYNPSEEFWVHQKILHQPGTQLFISDYRHNPFCPPGIIAKIEALRQVDMEMYKVYGRGLTGRVEGLIFTNWATVQSVPASAKFIGTGLDFGYTNDSTACVQVYKFNNELYVDELIYQTGLTNPDICSIFADKKIPATQEIIADSSEPKSIQEICNGGYNCVAVVKGADSIKNGINILKRYKINITHRSAGLLKEIRRYKWKRDKANNPTNEPTDTFNHALDALRYVALTKLSLNGNGTYAIY